MAAGGALVAAAAAGASAFTTRDLRTRFSAVSPESGVLSDKQGILAKRRALAVGERDVRDEGFGRWVRRRNGARNCRVERKLAPPMRLSKRQDGGRSHLAGRGRKPPAAWRTGARARQSALAIIWLIWALPTAPIWVAWTWPSLNSSSIGIERTWYFMAVARLWSTLTLAILALPA